MQIFFANALAGIWTDIGRSTDIRMASTLNEIARKREHAGQDEHVRSEIAAVNPFHRKFDVCAVDKEHCSAIRGDGKYKARAISKGGNKSSVMQDD